MQNFDYQGTVIILLMATGVTGLAVWRDRKPPELGKIWYFPWKPIAALSILVMLLSLAHLISVFSGHPFSGRLR